MLVPLLVVLAFGCGIFIGRYHDAPSENATAQPTDYYEGDTSSKFTNPLLFCTDQNLSDKVTNDMEDAVSAYIAKEKNSGNLTDAAFYFRDLNGGPWALVNPDFKSIPASLLKVPVALHLYKLAEAEPVLLENKVMMPKDLASLNVDQGEYFKAPQSVQPSTTYTLEDLIRLMLQDSDNIALYMLSSRFTPQDVHDSFADLGIAVPGNVSNQDYTISVKTYSSFFRILYNATYLTKSDSEHMLGLLSHSTFNEGIAAGLPSGISVAHKFGEFGAADGTKQLHDCGIVYKPNQPYLICIMTKGTDFDTLAAVISHISKMVYGTLAGSS